MNIPVRLIIALCCSFLLSILPSPEIMHGIRAPWVLLLILFEIFYLPRYFNAYLVLFAGLCMDILLGSVIGEHSFAFLLTTWVASRKSQRFTFFPMGQQMVLIGLFSLIYNFTMLLIDAFLGNKFSLFSVLGSAGLAIILWPWVRILADSFFIPRVKSRNYIL
jgi:rod shape-determining protein MreD